MAASDAIWQPLHFSEWNDRFTAAERTKATLNDAADLILNHNTTWPRTRRKIIKTHHINNSKKINCKASFTHELWTEDQSAVTSSLEWADSHLHQTSGWLYYLSVMSSHIFTQMQDFFCAFHESPCLPTLWKSSPALVGRLATRHVWFRSSWQYMGSKVVGEAGQDCQSWPQQQKRCLRCYQPSA